MQLQKLDFDFDDEAELPMEVKSLIDVANKELQRYWDAWHKNPIEQYVACDLEFVAKALLAITNRNLADGKLFCEWGCGFGVITGVASLLGWEAIGIEAESFLVKRGKELLRDQKIKAELWEGNFLPKDAMKWADTQADHASLFYRIPPAYDEQDLTIEDFSLIFAYPWPGEHFYLQETFRRTARSNALLLMFLGPYQIELFRAVESR